MIFKDQSEWSIENKCSDFIDKSECEWKCVQLDILQAQPYSAVSHG
jgi:hypothetical protein